MCKNKYIVRYGLGLSSKRCLKAPECLDDWWRVTATLSSVVPFRDPNSKAFRLPSGQTEALLLKRPVWQEVRPHQGNTACVFVAANGIHFYMFFPDPWYFLLSGRNVIEFARCLLKLSQTAEASVFYDLSQSEDESFLFFQTLMTVEWLSMAQGSRTLIQLSWTDSSQIVGCQQHKLSMKDILNSALILFTPGRGLLQKSITSTHF